MKTGLPLLLFTFLAAVVLYAAGETRYVDLNNSSPTAPYTNWLTAATNIQDAVDAATNGDLVLVNDGVYQSGFRTTGKGFPILTVETNRLKIDKVITVQSVNGPTNTLISGGGMYRCVSLAGGGVLSGFSLINGAAGYSYANGRATNTVVEDGGGVTGGGVLTNCVVTDNKSTGVGGGAYRSTLINCTVRGNSADSGGGAALCTLSNCTVVGNNAATNVSTNSFLPSPPSGVGGGIYASSAFNCLIANNTALRGGGAWGAFRLVNCTIVSNSASFYGGVSPNTEAQVTTSLTNSIVYFNVAGTNANYGSGGTLVFDHSCALPFPSGTGNVSNAPTFVDLGAGDLRMQTNSPCINAGLNTAVVGDVDLDANLRISGGTVDIGAYEYQSPSSVLSYAWAQQNGLPTDGSADFTDADGDGANNWQEWRADTAPTNGANILAMVSVTNRVTGLGVSWASVATRNYWLERASDLSATPPFQIIATNIPGVAGTKTFNDTSATNGGPYFYRVGVQ